MSARITVTDEMIEKGKKGVAARLRWASIHWGAEGLHSDAIPHIARAALEAVAPLIAAQALRDFAAEMTSGHNKETLNAERRAIKREARKRADQIEGVTDEAGAGHWSDPTPAGEVCRCLCHESGPALEHLGGGKCPCRTSGAINPSLLRRPGAERADRIEGATS